MHLSINPKGFLKFGLSLLGIIKIRIKKKVTTIGLCESYFEM